MTFEPELAMDLDKTKYNLDYYLNSEDWVMQEKHDGQRVCIVMNEDGSVQYLNRKGNEIELNFASIEKLSISRTKYKNQKIILDSEFVSGNLFLFDLITKEPKSYEMRRKELSTLVKGLNNIGVVKQFEKLKDKQSAIETLQSLKREGVVFRNKNSLPKAGKSKNIVKVKFTQTVDCFIIELWRNGLQAARLGLFDLDGRTVDIGGCKLSPDQLECYQEGDVLEVKYLYADQNHKLYQPVLVRKREDKDDYQCTISQLKIKE